MEFYPEIQLSVGEAEVMARGLLAVARADGKLHGREAAMVQSFFGEVTGGSGGALAALESAPSIEPDALSAGLQRPEVARMFVKTCILMAHADGEYHPKERAAIAAYAKALGIADEEVRQLEQSVKEYLVGQLAHLANVEAAAKVAKALGA